MPVVGAVKEYVPGVDWLKTVAARTGNAIAHTANAATLKVNRFIIFPSSSKIQGNENNSRQTRMALT